MGGEQDQRDGMYSSQASFRDNTDRTANNTFKTEFSAQSSTFQDKPMSSNYGAPFGEDNASDYVSKSNYNNVAPPRYNNMQSDRNDYFDRPHSPTSREDTGSYNYCYDKKQSYGNNSSVSNNGSLMFNNYSSTGNYSSYNSCN